MSPHPPERERRQALPGPSILDLVRLSRTEIFPPGGEPLYREIASLVELEEGQELLDSACGRGISTFFLASNYGVACTGVDPDPALVAKAEARARAGELEHRLTFQQAQLDDLPFKDAMFDVAIGEVALGALADPARAVAELVRVTRPMGSVVLVQLTWTGHVDDERKEILVRHLGARPLLLVEAKQMLRDAGVVELQVRDWSDRPSPFRPGGGAPFHDLAQLFTFRQKLEILWRAVKRWGWSALRGAIFREHEIHRLITSERALGLTIIKGTRWPAG
jgi:ubiquinone/menaquinone biosynthesis C-methylase UbiE